MQKNTLYVGAGKATIHFPVEMFPTWEGYTGIHDDPMVEVVVIECGAKFCLVNFELISLNDEVQNFKRLINELTGIPEENCWICVSHVLPTPHLWLAEHRKTQEDIQKNQIMLETIRSALSAAAITAFESRTEAKFGTGAGLCAANVNRCVRTEKGWWLGCNDTGPVDRTVSVLRFDRLDGTPIAVLFNYHAQSSILDDVYTKNGDRLVSSDLAGASARFVENELGGNVVAAYLLGAGGDSAPALKGIRTIIGKDGKQIDTVMNDEAYLLVDILGERLGQAVLRIVEEIVCTEVESPLEIVHDSMVLKGQYIPPTKSITPQIEYEYIPANDVTTPLEIIKLGDAALVGIKPEINCKTLAYIKENSPFGWTGLMTFVNGGQKYMPESEMYDMITYQSMNSRFAKGSAEAFREQIVKDLRSVADALYVGAGAAEIVFDQNMFPLEGFNGEVNDNPHARVLLIKNKTQVAVASLEMVQLSDEIITACKDAVAAKTGTDANDIWIHVTHAITTPHTPPDSRRYELYKDAIVKAVEEAAQQANDIFQPAVMGIGTGYCDVNANRDIEFNGEWYYGMGSTLPSNKTLTILRFDSFDGKPIGFFMSYGIKPTCIYNVEQSSNTRRISSDVPGLACTIMEEAFSAPCLFCMPAAGDQIPKEIAMYYELDEKGQVIYVERSVLEGIEMMCRLGEEMGSTAVEIAQAITCKAETPKVAHTITSFTWPNKVGDGEVEIWLNAVQLGEQVALVGLKPEVNCATELDLWNASPFAHTLIVSFLNGDQKYMPDAKAYELGTREFMRSGCAVGCAEQFVCVAAELLGDLKAGKERKSSGAGLRASVMTASDMNNKIEFGGVSWIVLDKKDGKTLVLSEKVLEKRAYHAAGGPVTWENSELRQYLNGEFIEKNFSDEEKKIITETLIPNQSNTKYGVRGGSDTMDRVFLLSLRETEHYLFGFTKLLNAVDVLTDEIVWWHLRSPGEAADVAACVTATGLVDYHGVAGGVQDADGGVRPAMWLLLD